jgi:hypothetical protein
MVGYDLRFGVCSTLIVKLMMLPTTWWRCTDEKGNQPYSRPSIYVANRLNYLEEQELCCVVFVF